MDVTRFLHHEDMGIAAKSMFFICLGLNDKAKIRSMMVAILKYKVVAILNYKMIDSRYAN